MDSEKEVSSHVYRWSGQLKLKKFDGVEKFYCLFIHFGCITDYRVQNPTILNGRIFCVLNLQYYIWRIAFIRDKTDFLKNIY